MKPLFLLIFLFIVNLSEAQIADRILFEYDSAGNQILRTLCLGCNESRTDNDYKDFDDVTPDDLFKFHSEDIISYYPNPVEDQLYLVWKVIDYNQVTNIKIFSTNGKLLNEIENFNNENSKIISFGNYPIGNYFIVIHFSNNESKSITIIKK